MMRTYLIDELESVRKNLVQMGDTTISLIAEALQAVADPNPGHSARVSDLEEQTDRQHRTIHDQCLNLITLQAPVAGDARLLTGIIDAIIDLEMIGDYAYEVVSLTASVDHRPPSEILGQIGEIGANIREALSITMDSWRNRDRAQALSVRPREALIRADCENLYLKLSQRASTPEEGTAYVDLMLVCKDLERILRHTVCIADQAANAVPLS
jgi:phosphate transport system protein